MKQSTSTEQIVTPEAPVIDLYTAYRRQFAAIKLGHVATDLESQAREIRYGVEEMGNLTYVAPDGKSIEVAISGPITNFGIQFLEDEKWTTGNYYDPRINDLVTRVQQGVVFSGDTLETDEHDLMWVRNSAAGARVHVFEGLGITLSEVDVPPLHQSTE